MDNPKSDATLKKILDSLPDNVWCDGVEWTEKIGGSQVWTIEEKRRFVKTYQWFNNNEGYGTDVANRMVMEEFSVRAKGEGVLEGKTVWSITVESDMVNNPYKVLHGGCTAYLIDLCSMSTFVSLGLATEHIATGVTQNLNINWHAPAPLGTQLRIIAWVTVFKDSRVSTQRCEIWDRVNNRLLASGVQTGVRLAVRDSGKNKTEIRQPQVKL